MPSLLSPHRRRSIANVFLLPAIGNRKRADIDELTSSTDLRAEEEEGPERQEAEAGEGSRESAELRGDRRQLLLEEKKLLDIANRRHSPRSDLLEEELEQRQVGEPMRRNDTDAAGRNSIRDTLKMLRQIV